MILPNIISAGAYAIENNIPSNFQFDKTEITNDSDTQEDTSNYSQAYLEYLELSDEEKAKLSVIPRKYNVLLDSIYEDTIEVEEEPSLYNLFGLRADTTIVSTYADELPDSFNLRNEIEIPVKDQRGYGLCWAFSSLRALETNLALHGYGYYDFPELHVGYFGVNAIDLESLNGENCGGNFENFKTYCGNLIGPVLEEEVPYDYKYNHTKEQYDYLLNLSSKAYLIETIDFPTINKEDTVRQIKFTDRNLYQAIKENLENCIFKYDDEKLTMDIFDIGSYISTLNLSNRNITDITGLSEICNYINIVTLDLSHNQIEDISNLPNIGIIDLSNNNISEMPEYFSGNFGKQTVIINMDLENNKENKIHLYNLIYKTYFMKHRANINIETENCKIDYTNK